MPPGWMARLTLLLFLAAGARAEGKRAGTRLGGRALWGFTGTRREAKMSWTEEKLASECEEHAV